MNTPSKDRPTGRARSLLRAALLGGVCLLTVALGVLWWLRPAASPPPAADLSGVDPAVATAVGEARQAVVQAPGSAALWGRLGQVLLAHGFVGEARTCFARAEQLDPREAHWPYYQGYILSREDPPAAVPKWRRAVDLSGDRLSVARLRLGAALLEQGRADEAEIELRRVLQAQPDDPSAHLLLGRAEYARGEFQESLADLGRAADAPPTRKGALTASAVVRRRLGDAEGAEKDLLRARDLPDDPPLPDPLLDEVERMERGKHALLKRGDEALKAGRVPEAVEWFQVLVRDYPDADIAWLRLGRALLQQGDYAGAERALQVSLDRTPDLVDAHYFLGVVRYKRGDDVQAAAAFRRAVELKPDYAAAQFSLGVCLLKEGDRDGARQALRAALECQPAFGDAHAELAALLAGDGRAAEAEEEARAAMRVDPANEKARRVLADLAKPGPPP